MGSRPRTAMKITTVRFGGDLWRLLEGEAEYAGISVSQYIREAALARAAAAAAARGHGPFELLAGAQREVMRDESDPVARAEAERVLAGLARLAATETRGESDALRAESEQTRVRHKLIQQRSQTAQQTKRAGGQRPGR
jgi:hypothetical protein